MGLANAFREQPAESPIRDRFGDLKHGAPARLPGEVYMGFGFAEQLASPSATNIVRRAGQTRKLSAPAAEHLLPPICGAKLLKFRDSRLLQLPPQHPGGVKFGVGQAIRRQHLRYFAIRVAPVPNRDG